MADSPEAIQALIAALVEGYRTTKLVNYVTISGYALVISDFLHTFPDEVRLMWPAPLGFPKIIFFALRYYIFVNSVFSATYSYPTDLTPEECSVAFRRITLSSQMAVLASEVILFFRVYAFSGKNKKLLVWLICQFIGMHAVAKVYLLVKYIQSVRFVPFPFTELYCMPAEVDNKLLSYVFALLLASIFTIMLIMMYLAFLKHKNFNNNLLKVFYRDGIYYFILLSGFAIANIVVNTASEDAGMKYLFINMEVNLHAILATRMILHLRLWAERERNFAALGSGTGAVGALDYSTDPSTLYGSKSKLLTAIHFKNRTVDSSVQSSVKYNGHWNSG